MGVSEKDSLSRKLEIIKGYFPIEDRDFIELERRSSNENQSFLGRKMRQLKRTTVNHFLGFD